MQNETSVQARKRGRLKWVCGGCLGMLLLLVLIATLSWRFLIRGELGVSAWENLPPSIAVALEAHDVKGLLDHAARDKGMMSLTAAFTKEIVKRANDAIGEAAGIASPNVSLADFGILLPYIVPGSAILGMSHAGVPILIMRPPAWIKWVMDSGSGDIVGRVESMNCHFTFIDGWMIVATERNLVEETIDNWEKRARPLGFSHGRNTPVIMAAGRTAPVGNATAGVPPIFPAPGQRPQLMALSDPFAANQVVPPAGDVAWKMLLLPDEGAWEIDGDAGLVASAAGTEAFFANVMVGPSQALPLPPPTLRNADVAARFLASPLLIREWLHSLIPSATSTASRNGLIGEFHTMLFNAWLGNSEGDFILSAGEPAVPPDPLLPPMPVVTMGWRLADGADRVAVAEKFGASVHSIVDSMRGADSRIVKALGERFGFSALTVTGGRGETLDMPPLLLNSAKPTWFFPFAGEPAVGWIASDPAGIRNLSAFDRREQPGANGTILGAAQWDLSKNFRLSVFELLRDRLETMPDEMVGGKEKSFLIISTVNDILTAYPRGSLACQANAETGLLSFAGNIPFGDF